MLTEFWIPLSIFAAVASFTPGPNNLMLAASGMNYGFRRSLPHVVGVSLGFPVMLLCISIGIGTLLTGSPVLQHVMRALSAGFILYFAWKIATAETRLDVESTSRPLTLWQAALFQWLNPKGWAIAIAVASLYAPGGIRDWDKAFYVAGLFFVITMACTSTWASIGTVIRSVLRDPGVRRWVNWSMAVVLVLTMVPILMRAGLG